MGDLVRGISEAKCRCADEGKAPIPVMRVREKLDSYTNRRDYDGAARHLEYWLMEARSAGDGRSAFVVLNEMMGVYRKMGEKEKALSRAKEALEMIPALEMEETVSAGTAYVNAGTVADCFGDPETAMERFEEAKRIYEGSLSRDDEMLAGLYNNMALALAELGRFDEAFHYYEEALDIMGRQPLGKLEQAVTYLNMANAAEAQKGMEEAEEEITAYLEKAEALLADGEHPRDGYYAFVCEKCAPTFLYYGWFQTAEELKKAAEEIYGV